jgi:SPFH domain, Band 7 family protein
MSLTLLVLVVLGVMLLASAIKIVKEYEQAVIFRLGKYIGKLKGPGIIFLWPIIDKMERKVDLRVITLDVPPQDVITRDNVSVKVNAVVYYRVMDPNKAVIQWKTIISPPPRRPKPRCEAYWASRAGMSFWPIGRR